MKALVAPALLLLGAGLAACGGDARRAAPAHDAAEWRVGDAPVAMLAGDGAAEDLDVVGVGVLSDGGVVVGDGRRQQLRVHGPDGMLRRVVGRRGVAPGELAQLRWLGVLPGDTLVAFDARGWRLTLYTADGSFVRSVRIERRPFMGWPRPAGTFADGGVLVVGRSMPALPDGPRPPGVRIESTVVARVRTSDGMADSLATLPVERVYRGAHGGFAAVAPFSPRLSIVATGGDVLAGFGADSAVTILRAGERRDLPVPLPRAAIAPAAADAARERDLALAGELHQLMHAMYDEIDLPSHHPRFDALATDDSARLWVRATVTDETAPTRWVVLDTLGAVVAGATLPPRFHVVHVAGDRLLGRWQDADDVAYVGWFTLRRP